MLQKNATPFGCGVDVGEQQFYVFRRLQLTYIKLDKNFKSILDKDQGLCFRLKISLNEQQNFGTFGKRCAQPRSN